MDEIHPDIRIAEALERIAESLFKLVNPSMTFSAITKVANNELVDGARISNN